jgi:putative addiction module CopG family antidote
MKNISISLTDRHAAAIEAALATGHYASTSEVIRAALRAFFSDDIAPPADLIDRDIEAYQAACAAGESLLDRDAARARILAALADR